MRGREKHTFNSGNPLEHILLPASPTIKLNEIACRINEGSDSSGVKVWVTPPLKISACYVAQGERGLKKGLGMKKVINNN